MVDSVQGSAKYLGPVAVKLSQIITLSNTVLDSEYEVFLIKLCIWFLPNMVLGIEGKQLYLNSSVHRTLFQKSCGL